MAMPPPIVQCSIGSEHNEPIPLLQDTNPSMQIAKQWKPGKPVDSDRHRFMRAVRSGRLFRPCLEILDITPEMRCRAGRARVIDFDMTLAHVVLANRLPMNDDEVIGRQVTVIDDGAEGRPIGGGEIVKKTCRIMWHAARLPDWLHPGPVGRVGRREEQLITRQSEYDTPLTQRLRPDYLSMTGATGYIAITRRRPERPIRYPGRYPSGRNGRGVYDDAWRRNHRASGCGRQRWR